MTAKTKKLNNYKQLGILQKSQNIQSISFFPVAPHVFVPRTKPKTPSGQMFP